MADDRDMVVSGCKDYGDRDKASFGENDVRLQGLDQMGGFGEAFEDPEGVCEILQAEVTAEFSGGDAVVRDVLSLYEFFLDAFGGADVGDVVASGLQAGEKGDIGGYVAGGAAAS